MSETSFPPSRDYELADRSYQMTRYLWFRTTERLSGLAVPFYLGRGQALNRHYNISEVKQVPMPEHVVVKISLTAGGAISQSTQKRNILPGEAVLRFVEETDIWEGYHPNHRGPWEFLGLIVAGETAALMTRAMIARYGRVYPLGLDHPIIKRLLNFFRDGEIVHEMPASAGARLVDDVMLSLLESAETSSLEGKGRHLDLPDAVEASMRADLKRDWAVADLANMHNVSREHLTRVFTRRYGVSPHRYLVELRVREACRRLRTTSDPIKRIVHDLGFHSHASFIRVFRQYTHTSPTAYRADN
jgi:AraC-like DNA-binding protein